MTTADAQAGPVNRNRFEKLDRNNDGRITREEWNGNERAFRNHDWNGDGVFEGMRVYGGRVFRLQEHLERLYDSAHAIRLEIPIAQKDFLAAVEQTVAWLDHHGIPYWDLCFMKDKAAVGVLCPTRRSSVVVT